MASTYDMKTLDLIMSGLSASTIFFGSSTGQSKPTPDPISMSAVTEFLWDSPTFTGAVKITGSSAAVSPTLNSATYFELLNTNTGFQSGQQIWFSAVAGAPYATISGSLVTGPSPYSGSVVFANRATPGGSRANHLWFVPGGALLATDDPSTHSFASSVSNFGAYNLVGAECFAGYTSTLNWNGGSSTAAFYGVADNNTVSVSPLVGVYGGYFEGRASNAFLAWGAEIDVENYSGIDPKIPNPNALHSAPGSGPLTIAILSQAAGSLASVNLKDSSAWAYVVDESSVGFRRGLVFGADAIKAASGHKEMLSGAINYEIAWYDATSANIGRLTSTDGNDLDWAGQAGSSAALNMSVTGGGNTATFVATNATNARGGIFGVDAFSAFIDATGGGNTLFKNQGNTVVEISSTYVAITSQPVKLGATTARGTTEGTNHLDLFNGTAPVGTLTNGVSLYSASGELLAMNAGGVATLLTFAAPSTIGTGVKTISNAANSSINFGSYLVYNIGGVPIYIPCGTVAPT